LENGRTKWRLDEKEAEEIDQIYDEWLEEQWVRFKRRGEDDGEELLARQEGNKTLGYVTTDVCFLSSFS
jgi:hypothetical protein